MGLRFQGTFKRVVVFTKGEGMKYLIKSYDNISSGLFSVYPGNIVRLENIEANTSGEAIAKAKKLIDREYYEILGIEVVK